MANSKPVASDVYQPVFSLDDVASGSIFDYTATTDIDGDSVRLNFVNGQRIHQPANADAAPTSTIIQGQYGTLTIHSDGQYTYVINNSHPDVASLGPGGELTDTFTYKISDGKGATDFGLIKIGIDLPERGDVFVDFEDAAGLDFPTGYKGFDWGAWRDGDEATVQTARDGNHYLAGGAFWTPIYSADGGAFHLEEFSVANGTADYDNILTIEGRLGDTVVFSKTVLITADGLSDAQVVDLRGYGAVDYLLLDTEPVEGQGGPDFRGAIYDDFRFLV